ncbi:MAG: DUF881 domain-containing protein [Clostridiales Family XIII bacterium]|jgi:uncharacterized protein YlxW (UPF0749 family)|nr:DUF881 domain-containing protein [Clostridiales Family XIII bacterium]
MKATYLVLITACFVLGFSAIVQAKSTEGMRLYVSAKTVSDAETSIASEKTEAENIKKLISDVEKKLAEYEKAPAGEDKELRQKLLAELQYYKMAGGGAALHGPGVVITVDDATREPFGDWEDPNNLLIHDWDILRIISELNKSGAEAISVNGHRVYNASAIICTGYTVKINGLFEARPFLIRAVGDAANMSAALVGPDGYGTELKSYGIIFRLEVENDISIPACEEEQKFVYSRKVKEGEQL